MKHRIERLPKWAQRYIEGLERRIDGPSMAPGSVNFVSMTRQEQANQKVMGDLALKELTGMALLCGDFR